MVNCDALVAWEVRLMSSHVPPPFQIPESLLLELTKLGTLLDVSVDIINLGILIKEKSLPGKPIDTHFKLVSLVFFAKSLKSLQSVQNLCRCGCGADALSLCSSLFENCVDLIYIKKAPYKRSRRYIEYEQVDKYYQAQKVLARRRLPKGRRKQYRCYERTLRPQVQRLLHNYPSKSRGWAQKSLVERAKAIGAELEHQELYWVFCGVKHTAPLGSLAIIDGQDADLILRPSIKGVYHAAFHSSNYFLRVARVLADTMGIDLGTNLTDLDRELCEASDEILASHARLAE
jgi:hypothetical protein